MKAKTILYLITTPVLVITAIVVILQMQKSGGLQTADCFIGKSLLYGTELELHSVIYMTSDYPTSYFWTDDDTESVLHSISLDNNVDIKLFGKDETNQHYLLGLKTDNDYFAQYAFISCGKGHILSNDIAYRHVKTKNFYVLSDMESWVSFHVDSDPQKLLFPWYLIKESELPHPYLHGAAYFDRHHKYHLVDPKNNNIDEIIDVIVQFYNRSGLYTTTTSENKIVVSLRDDIPITSPGVQTLYQHPFSLTIGTTNTEYYVQID